MTGLLSETIGELLHKRAVLTPNAPAICYENRTYSWEEADENSDVWAADFIRKGISRGKHVALWGINSPEWIMAYFALMKVGAIVLPINTCYKEQELLRTLKEGDADYLFYGKGCGNADYNPVISKAGLDRQDSFLKGIVSLEHLQAFENRSIGEEDKRLLREIEQNLSFQDTANILFTSGTSGDPKGVMLSHENLVNNSAEMVRSMYWNERDRMCLSVPLFHCFGITAGILSAVHAGAAMYVNQYYKSIGVMETIQKNSCTILNGVPSMFLAMVKNRRRSEYDLSSLKSGIIAGSAIHPSEYISICNELKMEHLQPSYGQTESSPAITITGYMDPVCQKALMVGKKIPYTQLRIWDEDRKREAETGMVGEIQSCGYHIMKGYYNREKETQQVLDAEGWLHTGDCGYLDEDGCLHITGRKKELIIRGGENIAPVEIENCILDLPEIKAVKVVGVAAQVLQEEIAACIIMEPGADFLKKGSGNR
ncbi:AMP-binding protein [Lacrimispora xylanisolvens]|uniref:AMP-binding protein n=1 Tax=Lacrimispora xylanisolvens TaxID=384636 RepID=UPI0024027BFA